MPEPNHDRNNQDCPLNDPETFCNPATRGLSCSCPERNPVEIASSRLESPYDKVAE